MLLHKYLIANVLHLDTYKKGASIMRKIVLSIILLSIISLTLTGCFNENDNSMDKKSTITIYTSIYPLYDFTQQIGKEKVNAHLIVPPGAEPHDWEPSAKLIAKIEEADILVYNGLGMESWAERIISTVNNPNLIIVNASDNVALLKMEDDEHNHETSHQHEEKHHHTYDPHIWLDPIRAIQQAENIKNALIKADISNKDFYENNFLKLKDKLLKLDEEYKNTISQLSRKEIIVSHAAFGYMADRYKLIQLSVSGLSPQAEPSPSEMAKITDFIKEHDIHYIFYEPLSNPKLVEVIAKESGIKTLPLNPLGNLTQEELSQGKTTFQLCKKILIH